MSTYLGPYKLVITNNYGEYIRYDLLSKYQYAKVWQSATTRNWYISYDGYILSEPYYSCENAMKELDNLLKNNGVKFLTQYQFDRLQVLL